MIETLLKSLTQTSTIRATATDSAPQASAQNTSRPRIAIVVGEPAGIGPDITVQMTGHHFAADLIVIADPSLLEQRAKQLKLPLNLIADDAKELPPAGSLRYHALPLKAPVTPGKLTTDNVPYVLESLKIAATGALNGHYDAIVTGPVHKGIVNQAGIPFTGQTEFLAEITQTEHVVMMLADKKMRVALATTHLPLRAVPDAITAELLQKTLHVLHKELVRRFGHAQPRILVCGLNPHAGEGGYLGREEIDVIIPVIKELHHQGMDLIGPLPADTAFTPKYLQDADAILCMYHDQGLPVVKSHGFGEVVNITLGLPFIRTSVDHGTACELAGTGHANPSSLFAAIRKAIKMCKMSSQANSNLSHYE